LRFSVTDDAGLQPAAARSAAAALAWILVVVLDGRADGRWQRLKVCRDEHCREAFYDASKNQSRIWCSMQVCGIRAKNRVFIERRRARSRAT
jgi:predicted RNA-binding Zn ribbon-like protein